VVNGNESILQSMAGAQGVRCARHALHTGWQPDRRPGSEMMMADFMWPYYISCGLITFHVALLHARSSRCVCGQWYK
jgi:hypothetical protein